MREVYRLPQSSLKGRPDICTFGCFSLWRLTNLTVTRRTSLKKHVQLTKRLSFSKYKLFDCYKHVSYSKDIYTHAFDRFFHLKESHAYSSV